MGSYYIPSNKLKGEGRILYIFTTKSLVFTAIGAILGLIFYAIFKAINLNVIGIIILSVLSLLGFGIGTLKFPNGSSKLSQNIGGDSIDEIIKRYILFRKNRKIYTYAIPKKDPDYASSNSNTIFDMINLNNISENSIKQIKNKTKEENK